MITEGKTNQGTIHVTMGEKVVFTADNMGEAIDKAMPLVWLEQDKVRIYVEDELVSSFK